MAAYTDSSKHTPRKAFGNASPMLVQSRARCSSAMAAIWASVTRFPALPAFWRSSSTLSTWSGPPPTSVTCGCVNHSRTRAAASATVIGAANTRALVASRTKPKTTTRGRPTGSTPFNDSVHQRAAPVCKDDAESYAYSSRFASGTSTLDGVPSWRMPRPPTPRACGSTRRDRVRDAGQSVVPGRGRPGVCG